MMNPFARRVLRLLATVVPLAAACALARPAAAQDPAAAADALVEVRLMDGSVLYGTVVSERADTVTVRTSSGVTLSIPRGSIRAMNRAEGRMAGGEFWPADPNPTRLFFGPTARAVGAGRGYLGVYELVAPFLTFGVTDFLTLSGGTPLVPELIGDVFYVAPKLTLLERDRGAAAVGLIYATDGDFGGGLVYGAATLGAPDAAVTAGAGWFVAADGDVVSQAVLMLGGELRASRSTKLITENYFAAGETGLVSSLGVRFFGEHLSADLGIGLPVGVECDGCFLPLVNFVYAF